jgi:hypothetical protein
MNIIPSSINVDTYSRSSQYSISWNGRDGNRYHVWLSRATRERNNDTLYKNPPPGVKFKGEGYFSTRQLSLTAKENSALFEFAMKYATDKKLFEAEEARVAGEDAAKAEENRLAYIEHCKKQAGPALYEALRAILDEAKFDLKDAKTRAAVAQALKALKSAQPQEAA